MDINKLIEIYQKFKYGEALYHRLMQKRIRKILIISTFYNAFSIEEEAKFSELIIGGYHQYNLTSIPKISIAINSAHALKLLENEQFDLVISTIRVGEPDIFHLCNKAKEINKELVFILLLTEAFDMQIIQKKKEHNIDNIFLWSGEPSLFLSIIKSIEDKWNAPVDTEIGAVSVILLIEDSPKYYSLYLPELYRFLMNQTQKLIEEEANNDIKYLRMRTRPKILLCTDYEEAIFMIDKYKNFLHCVISDIELGDKRNAGFKIVDKIKAESPEVPILIQSSNAEYLREMKKLNINISYKNTPFFLNDLTMFLLQKCGFGDFIFKDENGRELKVAKTFFEFQEVLKTIPISSFKYHSERKEFCMWLVARGELSIAKKLRKVKNDKFKSLEHKREFLLNVINNIKRKKIKGKVLDFKLDDIFEEDVVVKIGDGSLGGKGRGISFLNALINATKFKKKFHNVIINIPKTFIVATGYFDKFIKENYLYLDYDFHTDNEIKEIFLNGKLSDDLIEKLKILLKRYNNPIIVRSSGLLEDSQFHPFAGIYQSIILPNNDSSFDVRLNQLISAVKVVYSSVYFKETRAYINRLGLKLEEEKMAVIIQEVVGKRFDNYFYPNFAGVAQSYNYYPISYMKHDDGVATIALGLGKYVVEGEKSYRFCPKYPEISYLTEEDMLKLSQNEFYALNLKKEKAACLDEDSFIEKLPINVAEKHGSLNYIASTFNPINGRIEPGIFIQGPRIINFENILKYEYFPLANILEQLLSIFKIAVGAPVEIEFAVNLSEKTEFYILQVRPLVTHQEFDVEDITAYKKEELLLYSEFGCGHGIIDDIFTIVFLEPEKFDKTKTEEMKKEIHEINKIMKDNENFYILIGAGRWGSRDKFLGIPVDWDDISMAKVIVETGIKEFDIDPSQGTHFIHNIIALNIGYFNVPFYAKENAFIDWDWLKKQKPIINKKFFKVVKLNNSVKILMNGKLGKYAILKQKN